MLRSLTVVEMHGKGVPLRTIFPSLHSLTQLTLVKVPCVIDAPTTNFAAYNLKVLTLETIISDEDHSLVDCLYRFPNLRELILTITSAGSILHRLLTNIDAPPLILRALTSIKSKREYGFQVDYEDLYCYLRERCAELQTLNVPRVYGKASTYLGDFLPSLRVY
jgi:hypothetical protein